MISSLLVCRNQRQDGQITGLWVHKSITQRFLLKTKQQGFLRSGKYIICSAACCPQKAHSDLLCRKSKIKSVIQIYPPTNCNNASGKSALRPSKFVRAMSWSVFEYWDVLSHGCFLPHRGKTDKMANREQGIMGCLCCHIEANALTVNTSEYFSLDSYEYYETQFVGYYS